MSETWSHEFYINYTGPEVDRFKKMSQILSAVPFPNTGGVASELDYQSARGYWILRLPKEVSVSETQAVLQQIPDIELR